MLVFRLVVVQCFALLFSCPASMVPASSLRVYCGGFNEEVAVIEVDAVAPESVAGDFVFGAVELE